MVTTKQKNKDQVATEVVHQDVPTEEPVIPDEEVDQASELADALRELATAEEVDKTSLEGLAGKIEKLSPAAQKVLVDSPLMQKIIEKASEGGGIDGLKPGETYKAGPISFKKPWRTTDMEKFPLIPFTTTSREEYTWNGIRFVFEEDEQYQIPEPVYQMIMNHRADAKQARQAIKTGFGMGVKQLSAEGWAGKEAEDKKGE